MSLHRRFTLIIVAIMGVIGGLFALASSYWLWTTGRASAVKAVRKIIRAEAGPISHYAWDGHYCDSRTPTRY